MTRRSLALVGIPVIMAGVLIATHTYTIRAAASQTQSFINLAMPEHWVPFTADVTSRTHDGTTTTGKFYRRGDGSTARVLETSLGQMITIDNMSTKSTYVRFGDQRGWVRIPLAQNRLRPPDRVLRIVADKAHKVDGALEFDVWEIVARGRSGGMTTIRKAPALNGFTIYTDQDLSGTHGTYFEEFTNIQVGEPPSSVFLPPQGTSMDEQAGPEPRLPR